LFVINQKDKPRIKKRDSKELKFKKFKSKENKKTNTTKNVTEAKIIKA
jgi:hypothetical protein